MIKRKNEGYTVSAVIAIVCWFALLWMRTFTHMANYNEKTDIYEFLIVSIFTMAATLFYWWIFKPREGSAVLSFLFDDFDDTELLLVEEDIDIHYNKSRLSILQISMCLMGSLAFLFLLALGYEMWTDITVFTDSTYVNVGIICINKKYIFDPFLYFVFPVWIQMIFKGMCQAECRIKSVIFGYAQIIMLSLLSFLIFMKLPNVWLINLAIVESILVINGTRKYILKRFKGKKGNVIALIGTYELFWSSLLSLFYRPGQTFAQYMYGTGWKEYLDNVRRLIDGTTGELSSDNVIVEFLTNRNNYFLAGLHYGGWVAALIVIAILVLFLISTFRLRGKHAKLNRNCLVYDAAWWTLTLRVTVGIAFSLGIVPMSISLPFAGKVGLWMDTIALGLLFWSAIEAEYLDSSFDSLRRITDIFPNNNIELNKQETTEYDFELYRKVQVESAGKVVECYATWYKDYGALVLESINEEENWILIVENKEMSDSWRDIEDDETRESIFANYIEDDMSYFCLEEDLYD